MFEEGRSKLVDYLNSGKLARATNPMWTELFVSTLVLFNFESDPDRVDAILNAVSTGAVSNPKVDAAWFECQTDSRLSAGNVRDRKHNVQLAFRQRLQGPFGVVYVLWQSAGAPRLRMLDDSRNFLEYLRRGLNVLGVENAHLTFINPPRSVLKALKALREKSVKYLTYTGRFEQFEIDALTSSGVLSRCPTCHTVYRAYLSPEYRKSPKNLERTTIPATNDEVNINVNDRINSVLKWQDKHEIQGALMVLKEEFLGQHDGIFAVSHYLLEHMHVQVQSLQRYKDFLLPLLDDEYSSIFQAPPEPVQRSLVERLCHHTTKKTALDKCCQALNGAAAELDEDFRIKIDGVRNPGTMVRALTLQECQFSHFLKLLGKAAPDPIWAIQWQLIAIFMRRLGCRNGEAITRRLIDIEVDGRYPRLRIRPYKGVKLKSPSATRDVSLHLLTTDELALLKQWITYKKMLPDAVDHRCLLLSVKHQYASRLRKNNQIKQMFLSMSCLLSDITGWLGCVPYSLRHNAITDLDVILNGDDDLIEWATPFSAKHAELVRHLLTGSRFKSPPGAIDALTYACGHLDPKTTIQHYRHHLDEIINIKVRAVMPTINFQAAGVVSHVSWGKFASIRDLPGQGSLIYRIVKKCGWATPISKANNHRRLPLNIDWLADVNLVVTPNVLPMLIASNRRDVAGFIPFLDTAQRIANGVTRKNTPRLLSKTDHPAVLNPLRANDAEDWEAISHLYIRTQKPDDHIVLNSILNQLNKRTGDIYSSCSEHALAIVTLIRRVVRPTALHVSVGLVPDADGSELNEWLRILPKLKDKYTLPSSRKYRCCIRIMYEEQCRHLLTHWIVFYLAVYTLTLSCDAALVRDGSRFVNSFSI